ncbi:MAG: hypothetical protein R6U63_10845 [Longimicrobiales bacterium]
MSNRYGIDLKELRAQWLATHREDLDEIGHYAVAMELGDLELLMDPRLFYGPPRLLVRREARTAEIWLDEEDLHFTRSGPFTEPERRRILEQVEENLDELTWRWFSYREDFKRGRLARNPMTW